MNDAYYFLYEYLNIIPDINDDGLLNIQDIIILINFILDIEDPTDQQFELADINDDDILNVLDVILIVDQIIS